MYVVCIVNQKMLLRKGGRRCADPIEFLTVVLKSLQSIFELPQQFLSNNIMAGDVREFEECSEAL